jgi:hypothetical protein
MTDFPSSVYVPRTKSNKVGVVYDPFAPTKLFAEDITKLDAEVVAMEQNLSDKIYRGVTIVLVDGETAPVAGVQINKFIIPEVLAGYELTKIAGALMTANPSGNLTIDMSTNNFGGSDLLTNVTIEAGDITSYPAVTQPVVDNLNYSYLAGDYMTFTLGGTVTEAKGLQIFLTFKKIIA